MKTLNPFNTYGVRFQPILSNPKFSPKQKFNRVCKLCGVNLKYNRANCKKYRVELLEPVAILEKIVHIYSEDVLTKNVIGDLVVKFYVIWKSQRHVWEEIIQPPFGKTIEDIWVYNMRNNLCNYRMHQLTFGHKRKIILPSPLRLILSEMKSSFKIKYTELIGLIVNGLLSNNKKMREKFFCIYCLFPKSCLCVEKLYSMAYNIV